MKRRKFIKSTALSVPFLSIFPAELQSLVRGEGKQEKRSLGKTGKKDDITVAAYYYPGYHAFETSSGQVWSQGEWPRVLNAKPSFEGHWQPRVPLWGAEDESDPKVMEKKIAAAAKYGVNCFIFDWYWYDQRPNKDKPLSNGFMNASNNELIDFYLMWANHPRGQEELNYDFETLKTVIDRVISRYFKHPSYYKIDGKPVFSIYAWSIFERELGGVEKAAEAIEYFDNECKKAGFPGLHLQVVLMRVRDNYSGVDGENLPPDDQQLLDAGVDSLTHYQFIHMVGLDGYDDYVRWADDAIKVWDIVDKKFSQFNVPYFPQVSIGWDSTSRHPGTGNVIQENVSPDTFKRYLKKAKAYLEARPDQHQMVTINSWNEWVEGSYLEPDQRFGYGYLEAVRDVFGADSAQ